MGDMVDREGNKVSGIFNFSKMLNVLLVRFKPENCIVAWDVGKSIRHKLYPEYKQGRRSNHTKEDIQNIAWQMNYCKRILKFLPVKQVGVDNVEADDVIGYLVGKLTGHKVIVSNDFDFIQLIDGKVSQYIPKRAITLTKSSVDAFLGFNHKNFLTYKCIMGDSSDNIKGISGMGKVRTTNFMQSNEEIREEWKSTIERNMKLMSIGDVLTTKDIKNIRATYKSEKCKIIKPLHARSIFTKLKFRTIVSRYYHWLAPFRRLTNDSSS